MAQNAIEIRDIKSDPVLCRTAPILIFVYANGFSVGYIIPLG